MTRLADITGLDRIGIPVSLAVRPAAITLSVDAGKGLTREAALASAAMEAIERHSAEQCELPTHEASYLEMSQRYAVVPLDLLPLARNSLFHPEHTETWATGWDIVAQEEVAAPADVVGLRSAPQSSDKVSFRNDSNGLASGNNLVEALVSAIYELVERDAVSCHLEAERTVDWQIPRVRLASVGIPDVRELLDRYRRAKVRPVLFDCTVDTNVPTYMAVIYDLVERGTGLFRGYGTHLDPAIAMSRALSEAAQSRAGLIAGSRDDFFGRHFIRLKRDDHELFVAQIESNPESLDAEGLSSPPTSTFEEDLETLIGRLRGAGLEQVIVFDLSPFAPAGHVVRAVIPGLEGYQATGPLAGARARAFCDSRTA